MRLTRFPPRLALMAGATLVVACGEVTHPERPEDIDHRLIVFAALNPDSTEHLMLVWPVEDDTLTGTLVRVYRADETNGGDWTLVGETSEVSASCRGDYGNLFGAPQCFVPTATLDDGASYRVEVSAEDHAMAWGVTVAVGDFQVDTAVVASDGEETELSASWTASLAAHRYIVSLRQHRRGHSSHVPRGWYIAVDDTTVTTQVPEDAIRNAVQPLTLDVAAFDKHLYSFITSGNGGTSFSVPPIQNVVGGFGVVGSVRWRSLVVTEN